jgi:hypothetical protein
MAVLQEIELALRSHADQPRPDNASSATGSAA